MRKGLFVVGMALVVVGACSRTDSGDVVVERPGEVDIKTTKDTVRLPRPIDIDFGLRKDTVIIDRPTVTVKRDSVKKKGTIR